MPSGIKGSYKTYNCIRCDVEKRWTRTGQNKFCGSDCFQEHRWTTVTKPRIEAGGNSDPGTRKKYLAEARGNYCECCKVGTEYNGKPLVLQLDHIDGNSDNNAITNLRLLCPNCHSQTDTYGAKGQGVRYHKKETKRNKYLQEYKS
jgi:5-methylcytosine-specific restriction endonuclease McrA